MVHSPTLDEMVVGQFWVSEFYVDHSKQELVGRVCYRCPLPVGIAFDVFVEAGESRSCCGCITASKGTRAMTCSSMISDYWPFEAPKEITVILRASKRVALCTPDLYEIWDGELWFEAVQIIDDKEPPNYPRSTRRFGASARRRDQTPQASGP